MAFRDFGFTQGKALTDLSALDLTNRADPDYQITNRLKAAAAAVAPDSADEQLRLVNALLQSTPGNDLQQLHEQDLAPMLRLLKNTNAVGISMDGLLGKLQGQNHVGVPDNAAAALKFVQDVRNETKDNPAEQERFSLADSILNFARATVGKDKDKQGQLILSADREYKQIGFPEDENRNQSTSLLIGELRSTFEDVAISEQLKGALDAVQGPAGVGLGSRILTTLRGGQERVDRISAGKTISNQNNELKRDGRGFFNRQFDRVKIRENAYNAGELQNELNRLNGILKPDEPLTVQGIRAEAESNRRYNNDRISKTTASGKTFDKSELLPATVEDILKGHQEDARLIEERRLGGNGRALQAKVKTLEADKARLQTRINALDPTAQAQELHKLALPRLLFDAKAISEEDAKSYANGKEIPSNLAYRFPLTDAVKAAYAKDIDTVGFKEAQEAQRRKNDSVLGTTTAVQSLTGMEGSIQTTKNSIVDVGRRLGNALGLTNGAAPANGATATATPTAGNSQSNNTAASSPSVNTGTPNATVTGQAPGQASAAADAMANALGQVRAGTINLGALGIVESLVMTKVLRASGGAMILGGLAGKSPAALAVGAAMLMGGDKFVAALEAKQAMRANMEPQRS